jgi:hypothetical protein
MKGLLIFLAIACPVVLASPFFWSLVNMEVGAEPVGYVQQDGTTQWATIGPKSYWPDWALRPDDASVRVDSHFSATPTMAATGMASVDLRGDQETAAQRFEDKLESGGFTVARYALETWSADIPSRPFVFCLIEGAQEGEAPRTIRLSFAVDSDAMPTKLQWTEGSLPPVIGMQPSACF